MLELGRVSGNMLAMMLIVISMQAMAETPLAGRDFDHTATGFPLIGGHATAACETCHVAGVFKGTAKTCDGCHALGKRVVATPKSTSHIVTDAPCETCHFNTSTFLGARFNHGTAIPGQCVTCHNGRQSTGRPASHNVGIKATDSCDHCHRSYAFLPASWNHVGVVPHSCDSAGCHVAGANQYYKPANHQTTPYLGRNTYYCDECHNFFSWLPGMFIHDRPSTSGICMGCHDGATIAPGKNTGHINTTADCNTCHKTATTWLGASNHSGVTAGICGTCHNGSTAKGTINAPGLHIPLTAGGNPNCDWCHVSTITFTAFAMNHAGITSCNICHASTSPYTVNTKVQTGINHHGSTTGQDCSNCHTSFNTWNN